MRYHQKARLLPSTVGVNSNKKIKRDDIKLHFSLVLILTMNGFYSNTMRLIKRAKYFLSQIISLSRHMFQGLVDGFSLDVLLFSEVLNVGGAVCLLKCQHTISYIFTNITAHQHTGFSPTYILHQYLNSQIHFLAMSVSVEKYR